uniref:Uncharacterized protein n=1 Tax=Avena sativa TaxID=4498 RepID=A0ACD5ZME0_AVESA
MQVGNKRAPCLIRSLCSYVQLCFSYANAYSVRSAAAGGLGFRAILPQVRKEKRGGVSNQYYSLTCVAARVSTPTPSEQPLPAPFFSGPLSRRPGRSPVPASAACLDEMEVAAAAAAASTPRHKVKKQINLFYCAECEELALKIAAASDAIQLQSINWRNFPDGFPNLFINNAHDIRGQHVAFLASFSSPAVIFEQISVIFALPKLFIASFTLVLPFFPTGSFERVEEEGDVATAFTLARVLSMIPKSRGGPTSVVIYDIHALQERFYFGDDVLPCFETGIPLLLQRLSQLPDADNPHVWTIKPSIKYSPMQFSVFASREIALDQFC